MLLIYLTRTSCHDETHIASFVWCGAFIYFLQIYRAHAGPTCCHFVNCKAVYARPSNATDCKFSPICANSRHSGEAESSQRILAIPADFATVGCNPQSFQPLHFLLRFIKSLTTRCCDLESHPLQTFNCRCVVKKAV